ncbi:SAM-dependent methyltransferase [Frankia sp. CNm7]|uniref:SAM-dependent methyltransferase n=2 Tax=Frankia nepalensis TaxID=1836974 RepID=A0A937UM82_9ACTN|nr:SAM-dependent methyltransferase [Frankia nepalensis]MBL7512203.1 SAM-dependent methyltransferase [Frankia nepalensis]MBL7518220.1 SAM-dependent methyltransferase [Frankia nepalensis]MBL7626582.1 SAM-dependent methyltransferase [Frankia nepalensis]
MGSLHGTFVSAEAMDPRPEGLRVDIPHTARMYDYFLGGKNNFPADRQAAEHVLAVFPAAGTTARANRAFLHRAVRYLASEARIDQFLDVGTGIPTSPNLHEIAQAITPAARVAYVDDDPVVLAHARALLTSSPEGRTAYIPADLHYPPSILASPDLTDTLNLDRPIALSILAVLHFFLDDARPAELVAELVDQLTPGSYLLLSHGTADLVPDAANQGADVYTKNGIPLRLRTREEIQALVPDELDIVEPGIVRLHRWRPDTDPDPIADSDVSGYGLIAYKP